MITDAIFDLDDTLCDFSTARERGVAHAFETLPVEYRSAAYDLWNKIEPTLFEVFATREISRDDYRWLRFHLVLSEMGLVPGEASEERWLVASMNDSFMSEINDAIEPMAGASECLTALVDRGIKCHVLTNGPSDSQRRRLSRLGFVPFLDNVFVSEELGAFKPDPAVFAATVDRIGRPPNQILVVGDDLNRDILPARKAGLHAVHFAPAGSSYRPSIRRLSEVEDEIASLK